MLCPHSFSFGCWRWTFPLLFLPRLIPCSNIGSGGPPSHSRSPFRHRQNPLEKAAAFQGVWVFFWKRGLFRTWKSCRFFPRRVLRHPAVSLIRFFRGAFWSKILFPFGRMLFPKRGRFSKPRQKEDPPFSRTFLLFFFARQPKKHLLPSWSGT